MSAEFAEKINADVRQVLQAPDVKERLASLGAEPMPMTTAQFRAFVKSELDVNQKIVQTAGIKAQ